MDRDRATAAFEAAYARMRSGPVGDELRATYGDVQESVTAGTFWGHDMEVVLPEIVSCELHRYGLIEPGVTRLILDHVGPGSTFLDVGAHLGYFSLLAAGLGARVFSFEPSASTAATLARNVGELAEVIEKGVWSEEGTLHLKEFGPRHSAVNSFFASKDEGLEEPVGTREVPVTSLDRFCSDRGVAPTFIKIDAEGAEADVIKGARSIIAEERPIMTVEVGDAEGAPSSRAALDAALALGYRLFDVAPEGLTPHRLRDRYGYGNVALIP